VQDLNRGRATVSKAASKAPSKEPATLKQAKSE